MSQWTHVAAIIRVDDLFGIREDLIKVIGKPWKPYGNSNYDYYDYYPTVSTSKQCKLPCGSEGSLDVIISQNPNPQCLAKWVVTIYGDLRDYGSSDEIRKWFIRLIRRLRKRYSIRQAVCTVDVEYGQATSLLYDGNFKGFDVHEKILYGKDRRE